MSFDIYIELYNFFEIKQKHFFIFSNIFIKGICNGWIAMKKDWKFVYFLLNDRAAVQKVHVSRSIETKIKTLLSLKKASQLVGKSNVRSDEPEKP